LIIPITAGFASSTLLEPIFRSPKDRTVARCTGGFPITLRISLTFIFCAISTPQFLNGFAPGPGQGPDIHHSAYAFKGGLDHIVLAGGSYGFG